MNYLKDESGASAAEYGLGIALIAVAIIGALRALGSAEGHALNVISANVAPAS